LQWFQYDNNKIVNISFYRNVHLDLTMMADYIDYIIWFYVFYFVINKIVIFLNWSVFYYQLY
jgi:hypothetical protein